ncbi:MAG: phage major capsid protein [Cetobacterium sp.]
MEELLLKIGALVATMEKSQNSEVGNFLKGLSAIEEEIKKMNSTEHQEKITKLEGEIEKMAKALDDFMKKGPEIVDNEAEMKKHEVEMNNFLKTGEMGEIIKKSFTTAEGGALIPQARANEIIKEVMETSPVIAMAKRYTIGGNRGNTLEIPVKLLGTNNASSQGENRSIGAKSEMGYTKLVLTAGKITDCVNVSSEMIEDSDFNVLGEVSETTSENIAELIAGNVWRGTVTGDNHIEGIYNNTQVTANAIDGALTWEMLNDITYALPMKVRAKSAYFVSTSALSAMRNFKDANGNPLYTASLVAGEPGIYNGYRVYEDPFMDEVGAGKYPVFFGDMKNFYAWLDRKGMYMERDRLANTDGYDIYTRVRLGGRVRQFTHGKLLKIPAGL